MSDDPREYTIEDMLEKLYVKKAVLWLNPVDEQIEVMIGTQKYQYIPKDHIFRCYFECDEEDNLERYIDDS